MTALTLHRFTGAKLAIATLPSQIICDCSGVPMAFGILILQREQPSVRSRQSALPGLIAIDVDIAVRLVFTLIQAIVANPAIPDDWVDVEGVAV